MEKIVHQGRNVKRIREMLGMKQEKLAEHLGDSWTQKQISLLEAKEDLDESTLKQVASALKVPVEAIKNFDEEAAVNIIANTFHENSVWNGPNFNPTFNVVDKAFQILEKTLNQKDELIRELLQKLTGK